MRTECRRFVALLAVVPSEGTMCRHLLRLAGMHDRQGGSGPWHDRLYRWSHRAACGAGEARFPGFLGFARAARDTAIPITRHGTQQRRFEYEQNLYTSSGDRRRDYRPRLGKPRTRGAARQCYRHVDHRRQSTRGIVEAQPREWHPMCTYQRDDLSRHNRQPCRTRVLLPGDRPDCLCPQKPRWGCHSDLGRECVRCGHRLATSNGWNFSRAGYRRGLRNPRRVPLPGSEVALFAVRANRYSPCEPSVPPPPRRKAHPTAPGRPHGEPEMAPVAKARGSLWMHRV